MRSGGGGSGRRRAVVKLFSAAHARTGDVHARDEDLCERSLLVEPPHQLPVRPLPDDAPAGEDEDWCRIPDVGSNHPLTQAFPAFRTPMPEIPDILKALIAIVVLINPLEGIPLFLARTSAMTDALRLGVAKRASMTCLLYTSPSPRD